MLDVTRQYGPTLNDIRPDHVARYEFAAQRLRGKRVLDLACGCGYGSWILHEAGNDVTGVDISEEAIEYADRHYKGPAYACQDASQTTGTYDALVTFETLEHLDDPGCILRMDAPLVIASVPNERNYPFRAGKFVNDKYPHKRHYTPEEFDALLDGAGLRVTERFCQPTKQGEIEEGTNGLFLIYIANR